MAFSREGRAFSRRGRTAGYVHQKLRHISRGYVGLAESSTEPDGSIQANNAERTLLSLAFCYYLVYKKA